MLERLAKVVQHKGIDNEIHKSVEFHQSFKKKLLLVHKRSQMQKLTTENQALLKRIQEVPPAYNHLEWEEDAKRKDEIKRCMLSKQTSRLTIKEDELSSWTPEIPFHNVSVNTFLFEGVITNIF